ncbi:MAG: hypothetical protein M3Y13_11725 [Armatimonadota bacterium]|nr:hypothetical protein [Armatimonadota bacterium]
MTKHQRSIALGFGLGTVLASLLCASGARANDGGISFGGSPRLLTGHQSVTMQSEVVRVNVGEDKVHVDCQFVFQNAGPACTVRMGFPDQSRGADSPEEEGEQNPPKGAFLSYVSYVDGVRVPTQTLHAGESGNFWHAKTVHFAANGRHRVHDVYSLGVGSQIAAMGNGGYRQTYYILHTGSSWHGSIGHTQVIVTFSPAATSAPLVLKPLSSIPQQEPAAYHWEHSPKGLVIYRGPSRPQVQGRTLRFERSHWRPAYKDDILLYFGYRKSQ